MNIFSNVKQAKLLVCLTTIACISMFLNAYLLISDHSPSDKKVYFNQADAVGLPENFTDYEESNEEDNIAADELEANADDLYEPQVQAIKSITILRGQNLKKLFANESFDPAQAKMILAAIQKVYQVGSLKPGAKIIIEDYSLETSGTHKTLRVKQMDIVTDLNKIEVRFDPISNAFKAKNVVLPLEVKNKLVSGRINGSISSSARKAGADGKVVSEFVNLFSHTIDFQRDIKSGDTFKILYQYKTNHSGKIVSKPEIVYAAIDSSTKDLKELYRHTAAHGKVEYFNARGESTKKALLRTPINGARVTSGYAVRQHPIHGYSHFHQALDYGAKHGTPILAAGDGIVEFTKSQHRGYGRHVRIKHNGTYSTLYAHMSRFTVHPGARVEQGQVIGYVGATGDATGPHLHYEVIEKGKKIHPNKATFTKLPPLKGPELKKFLGNIRQAEILVASLEKSIPHNVAMASDNKHKVR